MSGCLHNIRVKMKSEGNLNCRLYLRLQRSDHPDKDRPLLQRVQAAGLPGWTSWWWYVSADRDDQG